MNTNPATIGHNEPPPGTDALRARLQESFGDKITRRDELIAGVDNLPAELDEESEKLATSFAKQIKVEASDAEAVRKVEKAPFYTAGQTVDAFFNGIKEPLIAADIKVKKKIDDRKRKVEAAERERLRVEAEQKQRIADEAAAEAQRKLDEAAALETKQADEKAAAEAAGQEPKSDLDRPIEELPAVATAAALRADKAAQDAKSDVHEAVKAAEAPAADLTRTRGPYGGVSSQHEFWTFRSLDRAALDLHALRQHLSADALDDAVRRFIAAGGRQLSGVTIYQTTKTVVR